MTDLQCPATVVLIEGDAAAPTWLSRVAAEFVVDGGAVDLGRLIEESTDLFRGEIFVVRAALSEIREVLRKRGIPADPPVAVEVDSSGWRLSPP
ncbi:MAG: hypothetical protein ABTA24_05925 [Arthrobacter sp.]